MQLPLWLFICSVASLRSVLAAQEQQQQQRRNTSSSAGDVRCGGILYARNGVIQTPGFPAAFETPLTCTWIIDASAHFGSAAGKRRDSASNGTSIVVYLTQLYVLSGLRFTGYLVYDDTFNLRIKSEESFVVQEEDVTQVMWLKFSTRYLELQFTIDTLHGTHLRALDRFLDVYGFNITYEVADTIKPSQCSALKCRFLGHCFAASDFRYRGAEPLPQIGLEVVVIINKSVPMTNKQFPTVSQSHTQSHKCPNMLLTSPGLMFSSPLTGSRV